MRRTGYLPWPHHPAHPHVVAPVRSDPLGRTGPTPKAARGPRWRRVATGWYVPATVDPTVPAQRVAEAAVRMPAYGAVTGWAALHWMGGRWFGGTDGTGSLSPVTLAVGWGCIRPAPGVVVSNERLLPDDIVVVDGLRVTTAVRSVLFEMRYAADLARAVARLDMAAYSDLVSIPEAQTYAEKLRSCTGIPLAREALPWCDENAWSPTEVSLRTVWTHHAGLPRPLTNRPVFDLRGRHLLTPDLIDPEAGVVGEYDGAVHLSRLGKTRDVDRDATYRDLGLELVVMTADDLADTDPFVRRLRAAYARAAVRESSTRRWTTDPPAWWTPTLTVEQRRALTGADRLRLLRHRDAA